MRHLLIGVVGVGLLVIGIVFGAYADSDARGERDVNPLRIFPASTIDISCVPAGCTDPLVGHENDPCQEDEVLWWAEPDVRICQPVDEICLNEYEPTAGRWVTCEVALR
jgi:hypothetical protein